MRQLADQHYPDATTRIRIVLDNFNTHTEQAFYEYLRPAEARQLLERPEFYFTPRHERWLNMVEIEFSVLSSQCFDQRIRTQRSFVRMWLHGCPIRTSHLPLLIGCFR
ncbi:transposase [Natrononativus amylolyticus]|uniref:transposase n=1 Tax=Natrononativus amylolyticus TaxID=2963434 RepID=UPI003CE5C233